MKPTLLLILPIFIFTSCSGTKQEKLSVVRQPAEFETQDAIWLIWPPRDHKEGESVQEVTINIISALINEQKVVVTCGTDEWCEHSVYG